MSIFLRFGLIGIGITLLLNVVGIFLLQRDAAPFFSQGWWSSWLPAYLVWLVCLFVGLGKHFSPKG